MSNTMEGVKLSMIIEFTPLHGSRLKRVVNGNGSLNSDEREWLTQFITKDLLQLQNLTTQRRHQEMMAKVTPSKSLRTSVMSVNGGSPSAVPTSTSSASSAAAGAAATSANNSAQPTSDNFFDDGSFIKVICLDQLEVAAVVMFFSLDVEPQYAGSFGSCMTQTNMYAVAIVVHNNRNTSLKLALPSIRDWLFNTHQSIVAMAYDDYEPPVVMTSTPAPPPSSSSMATIVVGQEEVIVHGGGVGDGVDVELEWFHKLHELHPLIDTWLTKGCSIDRKEVDAGVSIFARPQWDPNELYGVLIAALSHHRCILRSDDKHEVNRWLNTLALFFSDDRLLFASRTCFVADPAKDREGNVKTAKSSILAPDLNLQGTTASVGEIIDHIHFFRCPPVIIDVSKKLDEPFHFFPRETHIIFAEARKRIFNRETSLRPWAIYPHEKARPSILKASSLLSAICSRLKLIAYPAHHVQHLNRSGVGSSTGENKGGESPSASPAQPGAATAPLSMPPHMFFSPVASANSVDQCSGDSASAMAVQQYAANEHYKLVNIQTAIAQWRKQIVLKTLAYVAGLRLQTDPMTLFGMMKFKDPADDVILQVSADFFAQVHQQKERRIQNVLIEAFSF